MRLLATLVLVSIMTGLRGYAGYVYEDFEDFADGETTTDFYFYTDSTVDGYGVTIQDLGGETKAAYFNLNSGNLVPGDWVYFETWNQLKGDRPLKWMQVDLAMVASDAVAAANPDNPSLVQEVWYYIYADTTGDGNDDTYFETRATEADEPYSPLKSSDWLQPYPKRYFAGEYADFWDRYDAQNWDFVETTEGVPADIFESITAVGVQLRTDSFNPDGETNYMAVWVDNVFVIPEPSMLMLLLLGSATLVITRGRRARRT